MKQFLKKRNSFPKALMVVLLALSANLSYQHKTVEDIDTIEPESAPAPAFQSKKSSGETSIAFLHRFQNQKDWSERAQLQIQKDSAGLINTISVRNKAADEYGFSLEE